MDKVRVALAGYGWWGKKMALLVKNGGKGIAITLVIEPHDETRAVAKADGYDTVASLDDALANPDIDAVILATPHTFHTAQVRAVAEAGKHVFCEKPLALKAADAKASVEICAQHNVVLGIGHERRFEPAMAELLADVKSGALGRVVQIEANFSHDKFVGLPKSNWRMDPNNAPLAGMTATGIHLTDLSIAILGQPETVGVYCDQLVSEIPQGDTFGAHITFAGGGNAYIIASLGIPFVSRFAVYGSKGWVEIRDKTHVENPTGWTILRFNSETGLTDIDDIPPAEAVLSNLEAFAAAVRGEKPYPIPTSDMVLNTQLLEAMGTSATTQSTVRILE